MIEKHFYEYFKNVKKQFTASVRKHKRLFKSLTSLPYSPKKFTENKDKKYQILNLY